MRNASLESQFFNVTFIYNVKLVEKLVTIVHTAKSAKRVNAMKHLIFKMMKDIVKKNILNYLNLLRGVENLQKEEIPTSDDLIADCYEVYNKCINGYKYNSGNNFYYYFNKSLSRNFFRMFKKEQTRTFGRIDMEDDSCLANKMSFSSLGGVETVELLIDLLQFTDVERRICLSRCNGQRAADFIAKNKDISNAAYNKAMKSIKEKLLTSIEEQEL